MKEWILKNLLKDTGCVNRVVLRKFEKLHPEEYEKFKKLYGETADEKIYCVLNDITEDLMCKNCGEHKRKFKDVKAGYKDTCSSEKCLKEYTVKKIKQTNLDRYGTTSPLNNEVFRENGRQRLLREYGADNCMKIPEMKEKYKQSIREKYGVDWISKSDSYKKKYKQTCMERYGKTSTLAVDEFREKGRQNYLEKHGYEYVSQNPEVQKKIRETCLDRYGVDWTSKSDQCKNNVKKTCLDRYGESSPFKVEEFKKKGYIKLKKARYDLFKQQLKYKQLELLSSKDEYINNDSYLYKCLICNKEFESTGSNIQHVTCECQKSKSYKEYDIYKWLKSINIEVIQSDRKQIYPLEIDLYLPEYKLGIEFDGLYWHSELFKDSKYHLDKTIKCAEKGIQLIHIFENEWHNQSEIVKSIILSKLGRYDRKIYARQCEIREVSELDYEYFMELNHIQGYSVAKYRYGLYYNDELVHVCSFGQSRFKKDEIELIRSCSLINTQVVGGFDKLVKYFVDKYKPENLISYVDRRYFDGHGYREWTLVGETKPNYWYVNDKNTDRVLENRMMYQKHKLSEILEIFDESKTEYENMVMNGYVRIWDCGSFKFRYYLRMEQMDKF